MSFSRRSTRSTNPKNHVPSSASSTSAVGPSRLGKRQVQSRINDSLRPSKRVRDQQNGQGKPFGKDGKESEEISINFTEEGQEIQLFVEDAYKVKDQHEESGRVDVQSVKKERKAAVLTPEEEEKILREFDLNCLYGACRGITRMQRYQRALRYELKPQPSATVMDILMAHEGDEDFNSCIWDQNELLRIHRTSSNSRTSGEETASRKK